MEVKESEESSIFPQNDPDFDTFFPILVKTLINDYERLLNLSEAIEFCHDESKPKF